LILLVLLIVVYVLIQMEYGEQPDTLAAATFF